MQVNYQVWFEWNAASCWQPSRVDCCKPSPDMQYGAELEQDELNEPRIMMYVQQMQCSWLRVRLSEAEGQCWHRNVATVEVASMTYHCS